MIIADKQNWLTAAVLIKEDQLKWVLKAYDLHNGDILDEEITVLKSESKRKVFKDVACALRFVGDDELAHHFEHNAYYILQSTNNSNQVKDDDLLIALTQERLRIPMKGVKVSLDEL